MSTKFELMKSVAAKMAAFPVSAAMRATMFVVAVAVFVPMSAQATGSWTGNGADTLWSTAGNWDAVPGSGNSLSG